MRARRLFKNSFQRRGALIGPRRARRVFAAAPPAARACRPPCCSDAAPFHLPLMALAAPMAARAGGNPRRSHRPLTPGSSRPGAHAAAVTVAPQAASGAIFPQHKRIRASPEKPPQRSPARRSLAGSVSELLSGPASELGMGPAGSLGSRARHSLVAPGCAHVTAEQCWLGEKRVTCGLCPSVISSHSRGL